MRKIFVAALTLLAVSCGVQKRGSIPEGFDPSASVIKQVAECSPRGGLPNFFKKLESGAPEVNVAYFGGSITAQPGYRILSREYLAAQYPKTKVNEVYAAIGGTGSDLGAYRCGHDVLSGNPDLVIVEFAVNDGGMQPVAIRRQMEGIVRQIWLADSRTDIMFVYTVKDSFSAHLLQGEMEVSASVMEDIADYYAIPSVHFGAGLVPMIKDGSLLMKAPAESVDGKMGFSPDGVHPYITTGHVLYEKALERSWPQIKACGKPGPHRLSAPMVEDCFEKVETISFEDPRIKISGDWKQSAADDPVTSPFLNFSDKFYTFEPGCEISFKFKGRAAALYDLLGPQSSTLSLTVDGKAWDNTRFDGYCTYHRLALLGLCSGLDPDAVHTVSIKVSAAAPDKREILFKQNRDDFDADPAKYSPLHYFAGCIFIAGQIVE